MRRLPAPWKDYHVIPTMRSDPDKFISSVCSRELRTTNFRARSYMFLGMTDPRTKYFGMSEETRRCHNASTHPIADMRRSLLPFGRHEKIYNTRNTEIEVHGPLESGANQSDAVERGKKAHLLPTQLLQTSTL